MEAHEREGNRPDPADRLAVAPGDIGGAMVPARADGAVQIAFRTLERGEEEIAGFSNRLDERINDRLRATDDVPAGRE